MGCMKNNPQALALVAVGSFQISHDQVSNGARACEKGEKALRLSRLR